MFRIKLGGNMQKIKFNNLVYMNKKDIEKRMSEIKTELEPMQEKINILRKEFSDLYNEKRDLDFQSLLPLTLEKVLNTDYTVFEGPESYKKVQKFINQYEGNLLVSGYYPETGFKALKIRFHDQSPKERQISIISEAMKVVCPKEIKTNERNGMVALLNTKSNIYREAAILNSASDEYSYHSLIIENDSNKAFWVITSHRIPKVIKEGNLDEVLLSMYSEFVEN